MGRYKKPLVLFLIVIAAIGVTAIVNLRAQPQQDSLKDKPKKYTRRNFDKDEFASQFPVADYYEPEPADPEQRAKRQAKGSRYNNRYEVVPPQDSWKGAGSTRIDDWEVGLPPLPVAESDLIVIGKVSDAQAHLSSDKGGVYSEFTVRVEAVLKGGDSQVAPGGTVIADREGGRVKYAPGNVHLYHVSGMGMPRVGHRYALFLKSNGEGQDYSILTGYELHGKRAYPLDKRDSESKHFDAYWDVDEAMFEQTLRDMIARPHQVKREGKVTP